MWQYVNREIINRTNIKPSPCTLAYTMVQDANNAFVSKIHYLTKYISVYEACIHVLVEEGKHRTRIPLG